MSDFVGDDEQLFRRVIYDPQCWARDNNNRLIVTSAAFRDRNHQPSVDRANLCNNNPSHTQGSDRRNGVVQLVAGQIRRIDDVIKQERDVSVLLYLIDVVPAPLEDNLAHAEVRADPQIASDKIFRRLRQSLAILANQQRWLILPEGFRD